MTLLEELDNILDATDATERKSLISNRLLRQNSNRNRDSFTASTRKTTKIKGLKSTSLISGKRTLISDKNTDKSELNKDPLSSSHRRKTSLISSENINRTKLREISLISNKRTK